MYTGDTADIKKMNRKALLEIVRYHGPISQPKIYNMTNITPTTILSLLEELKSDNLIFQHDTSYRPDGITKSGRPPKYFSLNKNGKFVLGISVSNNIWEYTVVNLANEICLSKTCKVEINDPIKQIEDCKKVIKEVLKEFDIDHIGISVPGVVDEEKGMIIDGNSVLRGLPLKYLINREIKIPVVVVHNTLALSVCEFLIGEHALTDNVLYIYISEGVGAGMIFNGKAYSGADNYAGELGSTIINPGSNKSVTLNSFISNKAVVNFMKNNFDVDEDKLDIDYALKMLPKDQALKNFVRRGAGYLGKVLFNLTLLLNPNIIVISGKICYYNDFINVVKNSLNSTESELKSTVTKNLRITESSFKNKENSEALAGAVYALSELDVLPDIKIEDHLKHSSLLSL